MGGSSAKILLIGANGNAGRAIVKRLAPNHEIIAFVRSEPKFDASLYPKLTVFKGDVSNQEDLNKASEGVDIIISSYDDRNGGPNHHTKYANRLITAIKKNSVKRLIVVCGFGLLRLNEGGPRLKDTDKNPPEYKQLNEDMNGGLEAITAAGLNFTYVACPYFEDSEPKPKYLSFEYLVKNATFQINVGNIAEFIEEEIKESKWERKVVGISNV